MTITFDGTSKSNLLIHPIDPERFVPLQDMEQAMKGWIPYNANDPTNLHCVLGSNLTDTPPTTTALPTYSGVIGTILTAYNLHQNLVLRPDDIFIMILAQFSAYVNGRAEELRTKFVNHEGQMALTVVAGGTACSAPYAAMIRSFLDEISNNLVDPTLKDWFLPGFSTTTSKDEVVASAAAMCAFQAYFTYTFSLICGIPQVTLEGTVEDWKLLRTKVERLIEFDDQTKVMSEQWVPLLRKVLDNFVETAQNGNKSTQEFWDQIVSYYYQDNVCAKETHLTGWLSVFTFFDGQGQVGVKLDQPEWPRIGLDSINHNVVSCPVKIDDNGLDYNATLYVGSMAFDYEPLSGLEYYNYPVAVKTPENRDATLHNLIPRSDWAMTVWERQEVGGDDAFRQETNPVRDAVQRSLIPDDQCQANSASSGGTRKRQTLFMMMMMSMLVLWVSS